MSRRRRKKREEEEEGDKDRRVVRELNEFRPTNLRPVEPAITTNHHKCRRSDLFCSSGVNGRLVSDARSECKCDAFAVILHTSRRVSAINAPSGKPTLDSSTNGECNVRNNSCDVVTIGRARGTRWS
jgi:hypothetical protein